MKDYQVRLASIIEDFGTPQGGEAVDVEHYRKRVPEALIEFWEQHRTGIIMEGYFQFCDPARYTSITELIFHDDNDIRPEQTHVLGFGAFGTIVAWNEVHQNVGINLVHGRVSCQALFGGKAHDPNIAVTSDLMLVDDATFDEYDADVKKLFKRAKSKLGKLGLGQIYGFKPIFGAWRQQAFGQSGSLRGAAAYGYPCESTRVAIDGQRTIPTEAGAYDWFMNSTQWPLWAAVSGRNTFDITMAARQCRLEIL